MFQIFKPLIMNAETNAKVRKASRVGELLLERFGSGRKAVLLLHWQSDATSCVPTPAKQDDDGDRPSEGRYGDSLYETMAEALSASYLKEGGS